MEYDPLDPSTWNEPAPTNFRSFEMRYEVTKTKYVDGDRKDGRYASTFVYSSRDRNLTEESPDVVRTVTRLAEAVAPHKVEGVKVVRNSGGANLYVRIEPIAGGSL